MCSQTANGFQLPIAYASRTLKEHEKRYAEIDKEALAIMFGLKRTIQPVSVLPSLHDTNGSQSPRANFGSKVSYALTGSDAFAALGDNIGSLQLQY